jgi:PHD/YefM family antitoxin component YafN of YafNO toxin-antitoxin module
MTDIPTYSASQFARSFAEIQLRAQTEPVAVKNHGRVTGYFVSKAEFEGLLRLKALRGRARGVEDLSKAELNKLAKSEMSARHAPLDRLLRK